MISFLKYSVLKSVIGHLRMPRKSIHTGIVCIVNFSRRLLNEYREPFNRQRVEKKSKYNIISLSLSVSHSMWCKLQSQLRKNQNRYYADHFISYLSLSLLYIWFRFIASKSFGPVVLVKNKLHKSVLELAHTNAVGK